MNKNIIQIIDSTSRSEHLYLYKHKIKLPTQEIKYETMLTPDQK